MIGQRWKATRQTGIVTHMKRDEAIGCLKAHEADLKRLGVERLYLFGSTARDVATKESDVDLFFDYERGAFGVFELMDVKDYTASILGGPADIMTRDSLHKRLRDRYRKQRDTSFLVASRSEILRLDDIIEAIERIRDVLKDAQLDTFETDWRSQWLVERGVAIISEASRHLSADMKSRHPQIPWQKVAGIGNVLRHDYESIAAPVMWKLAQADLVALEMVCRDERAASR